jgi:hypothetical protein
VALLYVALLHVALLYAALLYVALRRVPLRCVPMEKVARPYASSRAFPGHTWSAPLSWNRSGQAVAAKVGLNARSGVQYRGGTARGVTVGAVLWGRARTITDKSAVGYFEWTNCTEWLVGRLRIVGLCREECVNTVQERTVQQRCGTARVDNPELSGRCDVG